MSLLNAAQQQTVTPQCTIYDLPEEILDALVKGDIVTERGLCIDPVQQRLMAWNMVVVD